MEESELREALEDSTVVQGIFDFLGANDLHKPAKMHTTFTTILAGAYESLNKLRQEKGQKGGALDPSQVAAVVFSVCAATITDEWVVFASNVIRAYKSGLQISSALSRELQLLFPQQALVETFAQLRMRYWLVAMHAFTLEGSEMMTSSTVEAVRDFEASLVSFVQLDVCCAGGAVRNTFDGRQLMLELLSAVCTPKGSVAELLENGKKRAQAASHPEAAVPSKDLKGGSSASSSATAALALLPASPAVDEEVNDEDVPEETSNYKSIEEGLVEGFVEFQGVDPAWTVIRSFLKSLESWLYNQDKGRALTLS